MSVSRLFTQSVISSYANLPGGEIVKERDVPFQDLFTDVLATASPAACYNGMTITLPNKVLSADEEFCGFLTCGGFILGTLRMVTPTEDPMLFNVVIQVGTMATVPSVDGRWETGGLFEALGVKVLAFPRNANTFLFPIVRGNTGTPSDVPATVSAAAVLGAVVNACAPNLQSGGPATVESTSKQLAFYHVDADGILQTVYTKIGAVMRIAKVQILLRLWPKAVQARFMHDMTLDSLNLYNRLTLRGANPWNAFSPASSIEFFSAVIHTFHLPVMNNVESFEKVLLGKWMFLPDRLRLLDFANATSDCRVWPTNHSVLSKGVLWQTILNCQAVLGAVWGVPFLSCLEPFLRLFTARPNAIFLYSAAYIAAQLEKALALFAEVASDDTPDGQFADERKDAPGCLAILTRFVSAAANVLLWEPYPCSVFFAPSGEYDALFLHSKKRKSGPFGAPSPLTTTPKPTPTEEKCLKHFLFVLSPPTKGKPWAKCTASPCSRNHNRRNIPGTRAEFAALASKSPMHGSAALAAGVLADTATLTFKT